jgi:glycosyltransferase involved in cell wall biosynthesis
MRILHINSYFSSSPFYKNLYDRQCESGLDITVYVPAPVSARVGFEMGAYTTVSRNHGKYDRVLFFLKHGKILKDADQRYANGGFDCVHAHSLFSNGYIAYQLYRKYGIPYIVAVRNTDVNVFFKKMLHLRSLGLRILQDASQVIFLSDAYLNNVLERYIPKRLRKQISDKSVVIPNGIDDFWLQNTFFDKKKDDSVIRLIYAGGVDRNKNCVATVNACRLLNREGFKTTYSVIGKIVDGNYFGKLKKSGAVEYHEPVGKEQLICEYRKNDIFVMPSIHESFGLVYAEALSQGLPVIYTKGQGFDGHFENGHVGYSIDPKRPEEIAEAVKRISADYKRLSQNASGAARKFSWEAIEKAYREIYEKSVFAKQP